MCQILRNAAAHESCILNDLTGRKSRVRTDEQLSRALAEIPEITKGVRLKKMSNERVQQITTLLFTYRQMAQSGEDHVYQCEKIKSFFSLTNGMIFDRLNSDKKRFDLLRGGYCVGDTGPGCFFMRDIDGWR